MELFINNCNRIELGPICSVIVRMIEKIRQHEYECRQNMATQSRVTIRSKLYKKKLSYEISNGQTCYLIKTYINFLNQKLN